MSRGGGGFRGGRGGMSTPGGKQRIGGQDMTWDFDPELVIETKPQEMFPPINLPTTRPPTTAEKLAVANFLSFRAKVRAGPLYTVLGAEGKDPASLKGGKSRAAAEFNPFDDMQTYTQRYRMGVRKLPDWSKRKVQLHLFPHELWDTIDPSLASKRPKAVPKTTRRPKLDSLKDDGRDPADPADPADPDNPEAANDDADEDADEDAEKDKEENLEDDFSEDDSEMGADYNAENYFDAGDQDDDMGGGDDDIGDGGFD